MAGIDRKKTKKKKTKPKHLAKPRKTSRSRKSSSVKRTRHHVTRVSGKKEETTYLYECTRPGCGYKIVRDEKAEPGQLRSDWKCPKCHHLEFRCLGKGDLPDSFQVSPPTNDLDYEAIKATEIGSN